MTETIRLESLTIGYRAKGGHAGDTVVASDVSASVMSGELTCLLGANGVGKSTLLRTLAAFQPRLGGNIYIAGKEIDSFTDRELARTVGVVLTDKPDVHNMTVSELVSFGRSPYTGFWGRCSSDDMRIVGEAMELTGISALARRMVGTLSDGERQKVMIAKALAQQTPVIYLDEPTAFLDYPSKVEMMQLLHRISRDMCKTVFLSTHDVELALQIADTVWLMSRGRGIAAGTPEDLALDGRLPQFFSCRGIAFDRDKGIFGIVSDTSRTVRLTGTAGPRLSMARKALLRNGIGSGPEVQSDTSVDVGPEEFVVSRAGESSRCPTIAAMLAAVLTACGESAASSGLRP